MSPEPQPPNSGNANAELAFVQQALAAADRSERSFRIIAGVFEIGAAWKKISKANRPYLSVTLDDPSFPATVYARLIEGEDRTRNLMWSRSKGD